MKRINSPHLCMFSDRYLEVESALDEILGTEEEDGAGEGIVADVHLALTKAEKRGAVKALRSYADVVERGPRLTRTEEVTDIRDVATRIESGEVTP